MVSHPPGQLNVGTEGTKMKTPFLLQFPPPPYFFPKESRFIVFNPLYFLKRVIFQGFGGRGMGGIWVSFEKYSYVNNFRLNYVYLLLD